MHRMRVFPGTKTKSIRLGSKDARVSYAIYMSICRLSQGGLVSALQSQTMGTDQDTTH